MFRALCRNNSFISTCHQRVSVKFNCAPLVLPNCRSVSSVKLAYNEYGNASSSPPVVIMHGLFGSKQNWRSISKALAMKMSPTRKIIAVDARNHGESPHSPEHSYAHLATDVADFLKERSIDKAVVIGHSMGGRAMMYLALKYPNLVDRAIIVDISPVNSPHNLTEMPSVFKALRTAPLHAAMGASEARKLVKAHLQKSILDPPTVDFLLLNLKKGANGFFWMPNVEGLEKNFSNIVKFPKEDLQSKTFPFPVLFIAGKRSDYMRESDMPEIRTMFPKAQLEWLDTGHLVQLEKPAEFISLVINFVSS